MAMDVPMRILPGSILVAACFLTSTVLPAADVSFIRVAKGVSHQQTGAQTVELQSNAHRFDAGIETTAPGQLLSAGVTPPGRTSIALSVDGGQWSHSSAFANQTALDTAFPDGNYLVSVNSLNDGQRQLSIPLSGNGYPTIPVLLDFPSLESIQPDQPYTLAWQPFEGGSAMDFIQLDIQTDDDGENFVFSTGEPGDPSALNGLATSIMLPANTLHPGRTYVGSLLFARITSLNFDYDPATPAITGYFRETEFTLRTVGNTDTEAPALQSHSPGEWNGPVPRHSGLSFHFSEPMQPSQAILWTGLDPARLQYRWSTDHQTLFCLHNGPLPANTLIRWQLERLNFRDLAGNPLPEIASGQFLTDSPDTSALPDILMAGIYKSQRFQQQSGSKPTLLDRNGFGAGVFVDSTGFNTALEGFVTLPGGGIAPLAFDDGDARWLILDVTVDTASQLEDTAPAGIYQITVATAHEGTRTATIAVPPDDFPSVPEFLGIPSPGSIDATQDLTLSWSPMLNGAPTDFITLRLETTDGQDDVFETPEFPDPDTLDGTATSVIIPSGTLAPGRTYELNIEFIHPVVMDTESIPGSRVVAAFARSTQTTLTTAGIPDSVVLQISVPATGRTRIRVNGPQNAEYMLEYTPTLGEGWIPHTQFRISTDGFEVEEDAGEAARFYRVRRLP